MVNKYEYLTHGGSTLRINRRVKTMVTIPRNFGVFVLLLAGVSGSLAAADEAKPLKAGDALPGPFQVLMVTGPRAGRFHCPVCEYDLFPSVLVFIRDTEKPSAALVDLLKKLDAAIAKHTSSHLDGCAIFLGDGGYRKALESPLDDTAKALDLELAKATVIKDERVANLTSLAKAQNLTHLTLGLCTADGPEKYHLDKKAAVAVLVYNQLKIVGAYAYEKDQLTAPEVEKILKQVETLAAETVIPAPRKT
jgi:hypothetical protein